MEANKATLKIQLLSYLERGSMYIQLERQHEGQWMNICRNETLICSRTGNRYIQFYELLVAYPRIIICNIVFENSMYCKENIVQELRGD